MDEVLNYFKKLETGIPSKTKQAIKDQIDVEVNRVFESMKNGTPRSSKEHTHLADTLEKTKIDDGLKYGYSLAYNGYNEFGVAYDLIARVLNRGKATMPGTHHIDSAVSLLKGIDARIELRVKMYLSEIK